MVINKSKNKNMNNKLNGFCNIFNYIVGIILIMYAIYLGKNATTIPELWDAIIWGIVGIVNFVISGIMILLTTRENINKISKQINELNDKVDNILIKLEKEK
jgi:Na+(H+)/acetate symporter ActP